MPATIIDGKAIAARVRAEVAEAVKAMATQGIRPGLAVVRVGDDPASAVYVRAKRLASEEAGLHSVEYALPATTTREALLAQIAALNRDPAIHGILVQLPLPKHLDVDEMLEAIDPAKDVDGFHPRNLGALTLGRPGVRPCTPLGAMRLLAEVSCDPKGKRALVIGRSRIVGKPMALMLLDANATVTIAHSRTRDLAEEVSRSEIVVAAVGQAEMVKGAWIREGAVVIDVGMNRLAGGKLVGDVEFDAARIRAGAITPVPGGVGPMTVAMLLVNTVALAKGHR